jgi:RNA polymerase sigma factor for flagellar operon FliA
MTVAHYIAQQPQDVDDLVLQHALLVKRIAYHLVGRLPPCVQVGDLIQAGMIGLIEAARHYDASKGASFATYAGIRIRGAMIDEIRRNDWAPRSVHRKARQASEALRTIESRHGRDAEEREVAEALGISLEEYHRILQDANACRLFSLDEGEEGQRLADELTDESSDPLAGVSAEEFRRHLTAAVTSLPERERLVLSLYYEQELSLREIGQVLGVTESRVSQIHGQALTRLKSRLGDWRGE